MAYKDSLLWGGSAFMTLNVTINEALLCGLGRPALLDVPQSGCQVHELVVEPLLKLAAKARDAGFCLQVASGYRSFERQLHIWNSKASGVRPVLDSRGAPLDISRLTERDLMFAILRWSALPGASRHHWGTDLDIYDSSTITSDYVLQLTLEETRGEGPFAPFHRWLTQTLAQDETIFFRPYVIDNGGVAPEPWHISYAPLAREFGRQFSEEILRKRIDESDILLKPLILANLTEIYRRYVCVAP